MVALRTHMEERYADWRADLPLNSGWFAFFNDCEEPSFHLIPEALEIAEGAAAWPGRRDVLLHGAPEGAHICRAFDGIEPADVRVVVLGQDPYPSISSATGRAFEDGTPDAEGKALRPALRALGQSALDLNPGIEHRAFCHGRVGRADAIRVCFDRLAVDGVLLVNTTWTFTKNKSRKVPADDHPGGHRAMWKPVTEHLLRKIAERPNCAVIFLLFGADAQKVFADLDLPLRDTIRVVRHTHPTALNNGYFEDVNPFEKVNAELQALELAPIAWWAVPDNAGGA